MRRIIYDRSDEVMHFVATATGEWRYDDCATIGLEKDGRVVAGVVYQTYTGPNVLMHCAMAESRHLLTPAFLCAVFICPFQVLQCKRVTGLIRTDNLRSQHLAEHLGFQREGLMREAAADGTDFIIYGMLAHECRFVGGRYLQALHKEMMSGAACTAVVKDACTSVR